ncbi:MAG: hypothetical protein JXA14_27065 [Anaerolineae bacterium]|nr:hypothetical protein [Anaerolineae bacterium]
MKTFWRMLGIATLVAVLGVAAVGAVALAQDDGDGSFDFRARVHEAIANALGVSVEEYDAVVEEAHDQVLDEAVAEGALTQEQADAIKERQELGYGPGMRGGGFLGPRGGHPGGMGGWMGGYENSLMAVAADQLGMAVDELVAALQDGETTIADLASAQGLDPQVIADEYIAGRADLLAQAVADGRITQEQADLMLDHMAEEVVEHLSEPFPFGGHGQGGCLGGTGTPGSFGRGRMGGGMGPGRFQNPAVPGSSDL